jgi:hypothetical protein
MAYFQIRSCQLIKLAIRFWLVLRLRIHGIYGVFLVSRYLGTRVTSPLLEICEFRLVGCGAVWSLFEPTFHVSSPSSGWKELAS